MKKKSCFTLALLLLLSTCFSAITFAAPSITFSKTTQSNHSLIWNDTQIALYQLYGQDFLPVTALRHVGIPVDYQNDTQTVTIYMPQQPKEVAESIMNTVAIEEVANKAVSIYHSAININGYNTFGLSVNGRTLIPVEALEFVYDMNLLDGNYFLYTRESLAPRATATTLTNTSSYALEVDVMDTFWLDELLTTTSTYTIAPYTTITRTLQAPTNSAYLSSVVISAKDTVIQDTPDVDVDTIEATPTTEAIEATEADTAVVALVEDPTIPAESVEATSLEEAVATEEETNELPTISEDLPSAYSYQTTTYQGQYNLALFDAYVEAKNSLPVYTEALGDPITPEDIVKAQETVNQKGLSSKTKYLVWTNIDTQKTYVFEGKKGDWTLIKHFICSTGKDRTPTPKGEFELTRKVPYFGVEKGYRCKYAFGFIGTTYLYHSIIFDKTGSYLLENKGVLGKKASDGCIRFSVENAKWFYDTLISGTKVWIN